MWRRPWTRGEQLKKTALALPPHPEREAGDCVWGGARRNRYLVSIGEIPKAEGETRTSEELEKQGNQRRRR